MNAIKFQETVSLTAQGVKLDSKECKCLRRRVHAIFSESTVLCLVFKL